MILENKGGDLNISLDFANIDIANKNYMRLTTSANKRYQTTAVNFKT